MGASASAAAPASAPAWPLAQASTFLFVPATRPERFTKALASGAAGLILDLEDAVGPQDKAAARDALVAGLGTLPADRRNAVLVRINAGGSPWHGGDVALAAQLVATQGLAGVVVPKAQSAADLGAVGRALGPRAVLLPLIESVAGLDAVDALARVPQVQRLVFGHLDFQVDLGMACDADETELVPVRMALVLASRRAGLAAPVDGVTTALQDGVRLLADVARSRRLGFGGKLCIHPAQVAAVHAAFAPSAGELDWAQRVLAAAAQAGGGGAVFRIDGRMVDAPLIRMAQRIVAVAVRA